MLQHTRRGVAGALAATLPFFGLTVVQAPAAQAYNVCSDPDQPCTHERMSAYGLALLAPGSEATAYAQQLWDGAGHEDVFDHIYGHPYLPILGPAILTMTHFWDADPGDATPSTYGDFEDPIPVSLVEDMLDVLGLPIGDIDTSFISTENALQKSRHFWSLALGAYADGRKAKAYEYLGHIVHFLGDMTVPTHAHNDAHVDVVQDSDPYEEWMSDPGVGKMILTQAELDALRAAPALEADIPAGVDPLYWLLYTTNQLADFFASRDVDGDTVDRHGWVRARLDQMAATISSPRVQDDLDDNDSDTPFEDINDDDGDLSRVRAVTYMYGIRAIAALYRHFERTVHLGNLAVGIDYVRDVDDDADTFDDADFYGRVTINGQTGQNRGEEVVDTETVGDAQWAYGASVPLTGTVPVRVEIWDEDGQSPLVPSLNGPDDLMDISPDDDEATDGLDLQVDMAKCVKREPGAITGDVVSTCGQTIDVTGDHDPTVGDSERAQVRFRVFVPELAPVANAGPDRTTPEGTDVELDGTGSFDPEGGPLDFAWDLDGDGACDDSSGDPTPAFTAVGNDGTTTVKVCVTDQTGLSSSDTAVVRVTNVAPSISVGTPAAAENSALTLAGTVSDPGWLDQLSATVDWGDGSAVQNLQGTAENVRPDATLGFSASHTYGDNGTFSVTICAADDDSNPCTVVTATVTNVSPTAVIDTTGTVSVNGVPTVIAHAGTKVDFAVRVTDPGSDDLTTTWDWGDGTPVSSTTSLVNPPVADPPSSPTIQPRDISAASDHTFAKACVYASGLVVGDDDGGSAAGSLNVVIVGNNHPNRPHGYWKQQYRYFAFGTGPAPDLEADTLACYLDIAEYMSKVFDERTPTGTFAQAYDVLDTSSTSSITELFDQQLLAAWLNFANGAIEWNQLVDTNRDKRVDTQFLTAMTAAESLRISPTATRTQLDAMKRIVESWTTLP